METILDEARLKEILKEALVELLQERKEVIYDLVIEAVEEIALARAIRDGETSGPVSREEIFGILERQG
ncbi:MAG: hypothetical protein WC749_08980 [Dehalococcoidia bacterium]